MQLRSLTYTSLARLDLTDQDVSAIHRTARDLNALEGITGLLIFNGTHFLQTIEGAETAIDDLLERLRRDSRHSGLEVRDEQLVAERSFPDWSMQLVLVRSNYFEAQSMLAAELPPSLPAAVRRTIFNMTEAISGTVDMRD